MTTTRRPAGRPRGGQPSVDRQSIGVAACEILRDEGASALTISRVAQKLEVRSQSLYHHVRSLSEIVDAARAVSIAQIDLSSLDADQGFEAGVEAFALSYLEAFIPLSRASWMFFQHPIHDHRTIEMYERFMQRALAEGLSSERSLTLMLDVEYAVFLVVFEHESLKSILPPEALAAAGATALQDALNQMPSDTPLGTRNRLIERIRELLVHART